jgi:hypothetical protein
MSQTRKRGVRWAIGCSGAGKRVKAMRYSFATRDTRQQITRAMGDGRQDRTRQEMRIATEMMRNKAQAEHAIDAKAELVQKVTRSRKDS